MTTVTGDITNILGVRGDGVVRVSARQPYPVRGAVVIDDWDDIPVKSGKFTVNVQPGAARFHVLIGSASHVFDVVVPDVESATFSDLVVNEYPFDIYVVSDVVRSAEETAKSAEAAKASEGQALVYRDAAAKSAEDARLSADNASDAARDAGGSESRAREQALLAQGSAEAANASKMAADDSVSKAQSSADAAAGSVDAAQKSASDAAQSASAASGSESEAKRYSEAASASADTATARADEAKEAADRIGTAETVQGWISAVSASAEAAKASAEGASTARDAANVSASAAKESETNAKASEVTIAGHASAAKLSETNAKASETAAKGDADRAAEQADAAAGAVSQAGEARDAASQSASQAGESARAAAASAVTAGEHADRAESAADRAGEAATNASVSAVADKVNELTRDAPEAFDTLAEIAAELEEGTSARAALTKQIAEKADLVHTHTTSQIEGLESALASKADASHTHPLVQNDPQEGEVIAREGGDWRSIPASQVVTSGGGYVKPEGGIPSTDLAQDLKDMKAAVDGATYSATANSLMKRTSTGAVSVADPTANAHAANKKYVDGVAATKADASQLPKIQVVTALPSSPDPSTIYLVKES